MGDSTGKGGQKLNTGRRRGKQKWENANRETKVSSAQSCSRQLGSLVQSQRNDWREEMTNQLPDNCPRDKMGVCIIG